MAEPAWKKLKLSLEQPYKDDNGLPIPDLLDITPDGQHIYAPPDDPAANVGEKLRRIFLERGVDFFERHQGGHVVPPPEGHHSDDDENTDDRTEATQMTPEELLKMRMALMPQLYTALGEMVQARDLLSLLLSASSSSSSQLSALLSQSSSQSSQPSQPPSTSPLAATVVTKPAPKVSVRAFNAQLTIGGKDKALRSAADLFKTAAEQMEDSRISSEKYWADALKIRRANWGLVPAPLPLGSATGKGAEKTTKDFLVSFGLEESSPLFRRRAVGRISRFGSDGALEFPMRQRTRLRVTLITHTSEGTRKVSHSLVPDPDDGSVGGALRAAQAEVVEQEVFSLLIKEASSLPTASAEVSERLIIIDAAQAIELRFELVDSDAHNEASGSQARLGDPLCNLVYWALHVLLSRAHVLSKKARLGRPTGPAPASASMPGLAPSAPPLAKILQPVIDLLQYHVFCERVRGEIARVSRALESAGIATKVRFRPVADDGDALVQSLVSAKDRIAPLSGEVFLRIGDRQTLRFTMSSPSTLTAHLPQATLAVASITQLSQLLADEIAARLLSRICELGRELSERFSGTWFVDLLSGRCVGRWEGCVLNFHVVLKGDTLNCMVSRSGSAIPRTETYQSRTGFSLFKWIERMVDVLG